MSVIEFFCNDCEKVFEISRTEYDWNLYFACPNCFSGNVKRVYTAPAVIYKGSGFYSTDNKKKEA